MYRQESKRYNRCDLRTVHVDNIAKKKQQQQQQNRKLAENTGTCTDTHENSRRKNNNQAKQPKNVEFALIFLDFKLLQFDEQRDGNLLATFPTNRYMCWLLFFRRGRLLFA